MKTHLIVATVILSLGILGCGDTTALEECESDLIMLAEAGNQSQTADHWKFVLDSVANAAPPDSNVEVLVQFANHQMTDQDVEEVTAMGLTVIYRFHFAPALTGVVPVRGAVQIDALDRVESVHVAVPPFGSVQLNGKCQ